MTPRDSALDRLFARYWDGTLSRDEQASLDARLESDPESRQWFREYCLQAVVAGEVGVPAETAAATSPDAAAPTGGRGRDRISRRTLLGFGLGTAAGIGAGAILHALWNQQSPLALQPTGARITWTRGQVFRAGTNGVPLLAGALVPPGGGVSTVGPTSSAVIQLSDGSTLCLSADTVVMVADGGERLVVHKGGATADLRPSGGENPVVVGTPQLGLSTTAGADIDLSSGGRETEVMVQRGRVMAADRTGAVTAVRDGELLTVDGRGGPSVRPTPILPDNYVLDFADRLPEGWRVGRREATLTGPVIVPELWFDPYHHADLYQVRSHNQWTRGLVRLFPDSVVSVRYRADRSADGQVVLVARRPRSAFKDCGCLEWNGRYMASPPDEWRTLTVRVADMLDNKETPPFAPPWVAFLLIFNTYTEDIGLRVADFRVTRPGST